MLDKFFLGGGGVVYVLEWLVAHVWKCLSSPCNREQLHSVLQPRPGQTEAATQEKETRRQAGRY